MLKIRRSCENKKKFYVQIAEVRFVFDFEEKRPYVGWMIP